MVKIQVIGCDVCRQTPALSYGITASDGRSIAVDLCSIHGGSVEALFSDFGQVAEAADEKFDTEPAPVPKRAPAKAEPRKAAPAKVPAPAKKAVTGRRRPRITSLEEIEAAKKA